MQPTPPKIGFGHDGTLYLHIFNSWVSFLESAGKFIFFSFVLFNLENLLKEGVWMSTFIYFQMLKYFSKLKEALLLLQTKVYLICIFTCTCDFHAFRCAFPFRNESWELLLSLSFPSYKSVDESNATSPNLFISIDYLHFCINPWRILSSFNRW